MSGNPLTTRVPDWLEVALRVEFAKLGHSPSEGLCHVLQEWWMLKNLPDLEWRKGVTGPRPAIKRGPEVWEVVMTYRDYEEDFGALADHYDWASPDQLRQALAFYELMPAPIDEHLEENLRLERLHFGDADS